MDSLIHNASQAQDVVSVSTYTRGLLGPSQKMLGPVKNGGRIQAGTPPGCWGPMITPLFEGGHEVTQPVAVEGASVGDAVAIKILRCEVTSLATSSGVMQFVEGRYLGDPFVAKLCSVCGTAKPPSHIDGIGDEAIHCDVCGSEETAAAFSRPSLIVGFADTGATEANMSTAGVCVVGSSGVIGAAGSWKGKDSTGAGSVAACI